MPTTAELRQALDRFQDDGDGDKLTAEHPACACENAEIKEGTAGVVKDAECLRYFVTSTSIAKAKKDGKASTITPMRFKRVLAKGLSVVRLDKASAQELFHTADEQYIAQVAKDGNEGGILGVIDVSAIKLRRDEDDGQLICCVLDTPMQDKPSHADVLYHRRVEAAEVDGVLLTFYNRLMSSGGVTKPENVSDMDIMQFRPAVWKALDPPKGES